MRVWQEGVFDGQEISAAHPPHPYAGVQGASRPGCAACLSELLRAGAPVNARLDNNLTLLMWAAAYGHAPTVRLLLEQGADRSLKDNREKTAAAMAREGNHLALAQLLE
jgi:uncharacterized protein